MFRSHAAQQPIARRALALWLSAALVLLPAARASAEEPQPAPAPTPGSPATPSEPTPSTPQPAEAAPVAPPPVETTPAPSATTPPPAPPPAEVAPTPAVNLTASALPKTEIVYKRPRIGLLTAGLVLFVGGWVADIGFTYGYGHQPATTSLIPIAGPFIQLTEQYGLDGPTVNTGSAEADARIAKNIDTTNSVIRGLALAGATICGVMQLAGLALTIAGIATKRKVTRYAGATSPRPGNVELAATASGLALTF